MINSDTNPDPNIEMIDPNVQLQIDDLVDKINVAHSVAFDVTFDDSLLNSPTFTSFGVHFTDDQETFFDGFGVNFDGIQPHGSMATVMIPLSGMVDDVLGQSLAEAGLSEGTNSLRIGISTNTDDPGIYHIDNFRLLTEVITDSADFNDDGFITGLDFLIWQENFGLTGQTNNSNGDANGDGIVDEDDLVIWEDQYGQPAPPPPIDTAVPEPSAWMLTLFSSVILLRRGLARRWS